MARVVNEVLKTKGEREEHVQEFFDWLTDKENYRLARKALAKNITFDEEIFDDAFQTAIVRTANNILSNGAYISDFQNYFFMCCKFIYIDMDNKKKNRYKKEDSDYFMNIWTNNDKKVMPCDYQQYYRDICIDNSNAVLEKEAMDDRIRELFKFIHERLEETFTPQEVDIFMLYYRLKSEGKGISYKNLAQIMGVATNRINVTIVAIRKFIHEDAEINEMKRKLIDEYDSELD